MVSPKVVVSSSLNVTATAVGVAQLEGVWLAGKETGDGVVYVPEAEVPEQDGGTKLAFDSPQLYGTTPALRAAMVKNEA